MGMVATGAYGVDRTRGRYTVYIPASASRPAKYIVYDSVAEAKADVDGHRFGYVYTGSGGKLRQVYQAAAMASFTPPPGAPKVQLAPPTPHASRAMAARAASANPIPAGPAWSWFGPATPAPAADSAALGPVTAGSVRVGPVTATAQGADVEVTLGTPLAGQAVKLSLGAQLLGNWVPIYNVPEAVNLPAAGWHKVTLHLRYADIESYLAGVNPSLQLVGMPLALGAYFGGHNTGIPGWTGRDGGSEQNAFLTLPPKTAS